MKFKFFVFILLLYSSSELFAEDQKIIDSGQILFAPIEKKLSFKDAQDFCSNLKVNNYKNWRLADTFSDLKPMLRADREMQEWRWQDVSFSFKPNDPHYFYCMSESNKKVKIENESDIKIKRDRLNLFLSKMKPLSTPSQNSNSLSSDTSNGFPIKSETIEESQNRIKQEHKELQDKFESQKKLEDSKVNENKLRAKKEIIKKNENQTLAKIKDETDLKTKNNHSQESNLKNDQSSRERFFKDIDLPDCSNLRKDTCYIFINSPQGSYEGVYETAGKGILIANDGSITIGEVKNAEFENGVQIYSQGEEYLKLRQEALKNKLDNESRARFIRQNFKGEMYLGSFVNGLKEGQGLYFWMNGQSYLGQFKNNQLTGIGIYIYKGNANEIIDLLDFGEKNNYSFEQKLKLLETFRGEWYMGEFLNGRKSGNGVYFNNGLIVSAGRWKDDILVQSSIQNNNSIQGTDDFALRLQRFNEAIQSLSGPKPKATCYGHKTFSTDIPTYECY